MLLLQRELLLHRHRVWMYKGAEIDNSIICSKAVCPACVIILDHAGDILHLFHVIPVPMPQVVGAGLAGEVTFVMQDPREDVSHVSPTLET